MSEADDRKKIRKALRERDRKPDDVRVLFGEYSDRILAEAAERRRAAFRRKMDFWAITLGVAIVLIVLGFFCWQFSDVGVH